MPGKAAAPYDCCLPPLPGCSMTSDTTPNQARVCSFIFCDIPTYCQQTRTPATRSRLARRHMQHTLFTERHPVFTELHRVPFLGASHAPTKRRKSGRRTWGWPSSRAASWRQPNRAGHPSWWPLGCWSGCAVHQRPRQRAAHPLCHWRCNIKADIMLSTAISSVWNCLWAVREPENSAFSTECLFPRPGALARCR